MGSNTAKYTLALLLLLGFLSWSSPFIAIGDVSSSELTLIGCSNIAVGNTLQRDSSNPDRITGVGAILRTPIFPVALHMELQADCNEIRRMFGVDANVLFVMEDGQPNAFAVQESLTSAADGTVFFGVKLLNNEFQQNNGFGIPTILAHEFAHILQWKWRFPRAATSKWQELHADFLAGWFTAHRARFRPQVPVASWASVFSKGDFGFFDYHHHGTPQERGAAFTAGFNLNLIGNVADISIVYREGLRFLASVGAQL
jgi:hypothetical protein